MQQYNDEQYLKGVEQKIRCFCDDCDYKRECGGYEEFWGEKVYRSEVTCVAELDPEWDECPRHDEYQELVDELEAGEEAEDDE